MQAQLAFLRKYSCKMQLKSEAIGHGLFTTAAVAPVTRPLVKGPWFQSLTEVDAFLEALHTYAARMLSSRVVRVDTQPGPNDTSCGHVYKVVACPVGFVRHFTKPSNQPNCVLRMLEGPPLGGTIWCWRRQSRSRRGRSGSSCLEQSRIDIMPTWDVVPLPSLRATRRLSKRGRSHAALGADRFLRLALQKSGGAAGRCGSFKSEEQAWTCVEATGDW